ncbi:acetyl-coenzyme A carboxylase carboxyl transferase subunit beta-like [Capsicum annuum]|uniref:acetyl-coenzyme A carboxylase carboxyl transferase subunit beta-like n=1 Tax=Capsicum annuum TaxID=4072 RepID=UPI001FB0F44F|nr:acetyl-coenzyme A carboxylase carboxyl transferase subunit beta-like [Capsicum annuum]
MAHLKMQMDFLAKHLLSGKTKIIKAVDAQGTVSVFVDAEANYMSNQGVSELEQQMSQLSATLNQRKAGTLPSDTVQNPRTDGSCLAITTQSGKLLSSPSMGKVVEKVVSVDELEGRNLVESEKMDGFVDMLEKEDDKKEEVAWK